jgi:hypothetical protein
MTNYLFQIRMAAASTAATMRRTVTADTAATAPEADFVFGCDLTTIIKQLLV